MQGVVTPLTFYVPETWWPSRLPSSSREYWQWVLGEAAVNGPIQRWTGARHASTVRTYLHLREAGVPCEITNVWPTQGIVITHTDFLPHKGSDRDSPWHRRGKFQRSLASSFVVCVQADRPRHPYAQMHIVQNGADEARSKGRQLDRRAGRIRYIPLWTQPGLLARDDTRGDRFMNVAYFGIEGELDPSLRDEQWQARLRDLGFDFTIRHPETWHDYRDVDVIVAARSFDYPGGWLLKPASKLLNAWRAGVPAIVGRESAYRAERRGLLDFVEVGSREDVETALLRLRDDLQWRKSIVENGRQRATEFSDEAITRRWRRFIEQEAIPAYEMWLAEPDLVRLGSMVRRAALIKHDAFMGPLLDADRITRQLVRHRGDWR